MSRDLNQCNFIGRLGDDPELKNLPNGDVVCNFTIAVGDDYKDKNNNKHEVTEWVRVVSFKKLAEIISQYCKKGSKVFITGKMRTRSWEQDGQKRYATEIVANEMQMLDGKPEGQQAAKPQTSGQNARNAPAAFPVDDFEDSDLPF
jgi:single-strand DNA-binding protein